MKQLLTTMVFAIALFAGFTARAETGTVYKFEISGYTVPFGEDILIEMKNGDLEANPNVKDITGREIGIGGKYIIVDEWACSFNGVKLHSNSKGIRETVSYRCSPIEFPKLAILGDISCGYNYKTRRHITNMKLWELESTKNTINLHVTCRKRK